MKIGGLQKFSLIDYPGLVCAVIFTQGCNFRCPYCHNPELVLPDLFGSTLKSEYVLEFLSSRTGQLDGVTITGGEPTIQTDLVPFLRKLRSLSFRIKLDTNGSKPIVLKRLLSESLVDYIAMDIKAPFNYYSAITKVLTDITCLKQSMDIILDAGIDYQFRTTVVPGFHDKQIVDEIKRWMRQLGANHVFQDFVPSKILSPSLLENLVSEGNSQKNKTPEAVGLQGLKFGSGEPV